jgi:hypothetical protein
LPASNLRAQSNPGKLVVHEWGTFTSLQGGDGNLIPWKPLQTSRLPKFVYDWTQPGFNRRLNNMQFYRGKGSVMSLQRMETPVIYFYAPHEQTVDISVQFPQGMITEWFPQAREIGPSAVPPGASITALDSFLHQRGILSKFSLTSFFTGHTVTNSIIHWPHVKILKDNHSGYPTNMLPTDSSGSHYFAARETDADLVRCASESTNKAGADYERFLFYRGVGNFTTPLRVSMPSDNEVTLANTGTEALSNLFILGVKSKAGNFVYVQQLPPGGEKTITLKPQSDALNPSALSNQISRDLSQVLVKTGLYPREAEAMVNTWRDSWFAEDGVRVLYLLPQTWTERTLPMSMKPAPSQLIRVMVGRAEVLAPGLEQSLALQFQKATNGDTAAADQARAVLKSLGRFAEPAFFRAFAAAKPQPQDQFQLSSLLNDVYPAQ